MDLKDAIQKAYDNNVMVYDVDNDKNTLTLRLVRLLVHVARVNEINITRMVVGTDIFNYDPDDDVPLIVNGVKICPTPELDRGSDLQKFYTDELGGRYAPGTKSLLVCVDEDSQDVLLGAA